MSIDETCAGDGANNGIGSGDDVLVLCSSNGDAFVLYSSNGDAFVLYNSNDNVLEFCSSEIAIDDLTKFFGTENVLNDEHNFTSSCAFC